MQDMTPNTKQLEIGAVMEMNNMKIVKTIQESSSSAPLSQNQMDINFVQNLQGKYREIFAWEMPKL